MNAAWSDLNAIVDSVFSILTQIFNLYTGCWLLGAFLMLWVVRKVVKLFYKL